MKNQKGAIVVEASLALTAFIFAIFSILFVVNICLTQAKVGIALNTAAKEISQYSYMYYALNVDKLDAKLHQGTEDSRKLAKDTITGVDTFMDSLSDGKTAVSNGDIDRLFAAIESGANSVDSLVTEYGDAIRNDPKGFIMGMAKMAGDELKEEAKRVLAQVLAKCFMEKNLISNPSDTADAFLRRNHVKDGMDGLDFNYTTFLVGGESNVIQLVVTYDIHVVKLLNFDFAFKIRQCSKTTAWGNGISVLAPVPEKKPGDSSETNLWTDTGPLDRGQQIVANEKKEFDYVSSGYGFDAYVEENNEFVTIISVNPHEKSYQDEDVLKRQLESAYNKLYNDVSELDSQIEVKDKDGNTVTKDSDPATRNYRVVMVLPEDADRATIDRIVKEFEQSHPGVTVEVKYDYGNGAPSEEPGGADAEIPTVPAGNQSEEEEK